jgi:hypothetical protein
VVLLALSAIQADPYFRPSAQQARLGSVPKEFSSGNITLSMGQAAVSTFDYSSYEPAILRVVVEYSTVQASGPVSVYLNGRYLGLLGAAEPGKSVGLTAITFAGVELVETPDYGATSAPNALAFVSDEPYGFEGEFTFHIYLIGSQ